MFGKLLIRTIRFITHPFGFSLVFFLIAAWVFVNRQRLAGGPALSAEQEFRSVINEMSEHDPKVAKRLRKIENHEIRMGLIAAARSAGFQGDRRPILANMAKEYAQGKTPYRAQLAAIPFFENRFRDETNLKNLMNAHATVLETMELSGHGNNTTIYMAHLEQARQNPVLWSMVWDDPFALSIWVKTQDIETLRIYHRNREWLSDPLSMIDLNDNSNPDWTLQSAIHRLGQFEKTAKRVVEDADFGELGISVMLTHGGLVEACWHRHEIEPSETVAVISLNPDIMGEKERSSEWITEKAAWLSVIRKNHPSVWLTAMQSPFALRLFQDAPTVASPILEKYGYMDIPTMIYQHFEEPAVVEAALRAIEAFGDLAFFVFAQYEDEHYSKSIAQYLVDPEIGIRVVPFIVRYGDEAFQRIEQKKTWVDTYFEPDGRPREDALDWIQYIPGGAALHVARKWAKGYPCEPGELGWAAYDVGSAILAVASFGSSAPVTTKARVAAQAKRASSIVVKRSSALARWSRRLRVAQKTGRYRRVAAASRIAVDSARFAGKPIWAGIRLVRWAGHAGYKSLKLTIQGWKHLSPTTRRIVYRSLLATALFIRITQTTAPNMDEIAEGVGTLTARITTGAVKTLSTALATAVKETMVEFSISNPFRTAIVYVAIGVFLVLSFAGALKGILLRQSATSANA